MRTGRGIIRTLAIGWAVLFLAVLPAAGFLQRERESDVRLLTYNVEAYLLDPARQPAFGRILKAIGPDVIFFQEMPSSATVDQVQSFLDAAVGGSWDVWFGITDGFIKNALASRYPLSRTRTNTTPLAGTRGVTIALVNLPEEIYARNLYVLGVHLKAFSDSGSIANRQWSCDAIASWLGYVRGAPGAPERPQPFRLSNGTPMVVAGDFNFVAGVQPEITLRTGAIQDTATFGPPLKGDWDESDLIDARPVNPVDGNENTWRSGHWPTSRLDRFYYTGSVASVGNSFILNTLKMSQAQLAAAGLNSRDTHYDVSADHLPVVIDLRVATVPPPAPTPFPSAGPAAAALFREDGGLWAVRGVTRAYFGREDDHPVPGDYGGKGWWDIAIFRPSTGLWSVRGLTRFYFGGSDSIPVPADYDGDRVRDFAVFRPVSGLWAVRGLTRIYFGREGDLPVPADYSGNGTGEFAVFRSSSGLWSVRGGTRIYFGGEGDIPLPGDYSGSGTAGPALFRPSSGLWAVRGVTRAYFGREDDLPVPADYSGDGTGEIAVFRPAAGLWSIRGFSRLYFGGAGDQPVPGDYSGP